MGNQSQCRVSNTLLAKRLAGRFPRKSKKHQLPQHRREEMRKQTTRAQIAFWRTGWKAGKTEGCVACHSSTQCHHAHAWSCPRNRKYVASQDVVKAMSEEDSRRCEKRIARRQSKLAKQMGCAPATVTKRRSKPLKKVADATKTCCCEGRKQCAESGKKGRPPSCCHNCECRHHH